MGKITITDDLIASIAGYAGVENVGIVGMNAKRASDPFIELFGIDNMRRGVSRITSYNVCYTKLLRSVELVNTSAEAADKIAGLGIVGSAEIAAAAIDARMPVGQESIRVRQTPVGFDGA